MKYHSQNSLSLCGLLISVMDYNDLAGIKTTYGSPIFANDIAKFSYAIIAKLEDNSAIAVAKSNVP